MLWLADKLANIRSIAGLYSEKGEALWQEFNEPDPEEQRWYYSSVAELLELEFNKTAAFKELIKHINFIWPGSFDSDKARFRKYKEVSVDGCKLIASGAKGDVYRYDDELIIKVFNNKNTYRDVEQEIGLSRKAFVMGIPTAISFGIVAVGDRYGAMYELLDSETFSSLIERNPASVDHYAALFADLARTIHGIHVTPEDIFSPEYFEKLSDVKMPASKLELLVKMLRKQITEYGKTNQVAAKKFQEMLERTIEEYHERRKHLSAEEAGATQEQASEDIIKSATEQALSILRDMNEDKESFRKIGLTFEEKAFYDILIALRDQYNFEYGTDIEVDGTIINDKCKQLAKKVKEIIDLKSSVSDWLNNQNVRSQLKLDIKICLVKNGYPPQYSPEVFSKVMEQVENFEENSLNDVSEKSDNRDRFMRIEPASYEYEPVSSMMVADNITNNNHGDSYQ